MEHVGIDNAWERGRYADRCTARRSDLDTAAAFLIDACRKVHGVRQIFAFGSYARGDVAPTSDLDALIVRDTDLPKGERQDDIRRALPLTRTGFDLIVVRPDEYRDLLHQNSFGRTILKDAVLLANFEDDTMGERPHA